MSKCFLSEEAAKSYILLQCGLDPAKTEIKEVPGLQTMGLDALLLDDPECSEELKSRIKNKYNAQKGFEVKVPGKGRLRFVIGPFRDGFDCWVLNDNGTALRL